MKLAIAADLIPNKVGGLESTLFALGREAEVRGHEVVYLFSGDATPAVREYFELEGCRLIEGLGELCEAAARPRWIEALKAESADAVFLLFFPSAERFTLQTRRACGDARIVFYDEVSRRIPRRPLLKDWAARARSWAINRRIDAFGAVSEYVATVLRTADHVPAGKIRVVHNGVDPARFAPTADDPDVDLAAVCHLRPEKGVDVLLEALALLKREGREVSLRLVGTGPHRDAYQAFARREGLAGVEFLNSRDDVHRIFPSARLAVVPSVWPEAFGYAAIEAMACARPVIASDVGGLPEVVDHGNTGLLVPPGDPKALADAIKALLDDPQRRHQMAAAARLRVEKLFTLHRQVQQLLLLLQMDPRRNGDG
jgi:glycosyltransferase involved in cell wall biosynthesis